MEVVPEQCPICFGEDAPEVALACGHMFCKHCMDSYKQSCNEGWGCYGIITATCPCCRSGNAQERPVGDRLKASIQTQVDDNLSLANKKIVFTKAAEDARWSPTSDETDWSKVTRIKVHC